MLDQSNFRISPMKTEVIVLGRREVERLLDLDDMLEALADGFRAISRGSAAAPNRVSVTASQGRMNAMLGYMPEHGLGAKLVGVFPRNGERNLPTHPATIALFDPDTGALRSIMDGTYLTKVRTAGCSAIAVKLLAKRDANSLAIIGAGTQGDAHLELVRRQRAFADIRIASRSYDHALALAGQHRDARAVHSVEEAVTGAQVVCCCTLSPDPVVRHGWLADGALVVSVGGEELESETLHSAKLFVEARVAFQPPPAGAPGLAGMEAQSATELGEVLLETRPGRTSDADLIVYKSMGHAAEDLAVASLVDRNARRGRIGTRIEIG